MSHIGIAGAGLFGRVLAFYLIQTGSRVTLFDSDSRAGTRSCGLAGAGMLTPYAELETGEPVVHRLGIRSLKLWPRLLADLPLPVFFQKAGSLVVAHNQDKDELLRMLGRIRQKTKARDGVKQWDARALAEKEPGLGSRFNRGIFFPEEGQLEGWELFPALAAFFDGHEVIWHEQSPVIALEPGRIHTESASHGFDHVVDCRGLGASQVIKALRGVRGELIAVRAPEVHLNRPVRLIHPRYPLYIVPRPDHIFLIGATAIETDHMGPIRVRSALELLSAAYSLHAGFAEAVIVSISVNCRPALPDNRPAIIHQDGLTRVNGLYRHGYLVSPALALETIAAIENRPLDDNGEELLQTTTYQ